MRSHLSDHVRRRIARALVSAAVVTAAFTLQPAVAYAGTFDFNGSAEYQTDIYGYYYAMTGGKFPTGTTPNGDNASGGTFRYINDEPAWGYAINTWHKDDWFPSNAGIAMTFKEDGDIVYDNNGIEDGSYGNYYNATAQGLDSIDTPGLYRGFSMPNVWAWMYAGYFLVEEEMEIDTLIGYFDEVAGFDRNNPLIGYSMNIFSNVDGDLLPVNTGSFMGDVFHMSTLTDPDAFSTSDTGVDRVFGVDDGSITDDIFRLTLELPEEITLQPGVYWFSHGAHVQPIDVAEPGTLALFGMGLAGLGFMRRRRAA